ncbi:hypothetical protein KSS87_017925, partial [Heliosperma pusillum]
MFLVVSGTFQIVWNIPDVSGVVMSRTFQKVP